MEPFSPVRREHFEFVGALADQGDLDAGSLAPPPPVEEGALRPGASPPGYGRQELKLTEDQLNAVGREYCEILDYHDNAMAGFFRVEEAIKKAYSQITDSLQTGIRPGDANYCSESTMTLVDQATARIFSNIAGVEPLARCIPIAGGEYGDLAIATCQAAEHFLQNYGQRQVKMLPLLSRAVHRACKVGTAVLKGQWHVEERKTFYYTADSDKAKEKTEQRGRVKFELVPNRLVKIWPPTLYDWQEEYQLVGHDTWLTRGQFRALAASLKLDAATQKMIEATAGWDRDLKEDEGLALHDIERRAMSHKSDERVRITECWIHDVLPGLDRMGKYQIYLCRPLQLCFWADHNRFHTQGHPYFPLRYKLIDEVAWGAGIGHEVLFPQHASTALQNIRLDGLKAGCYHFVVCKPDYVHQQQTLAPMHGQRVISEDPEHDYIPRKLGGEIPEINDAIADMDYRGAKAAGFPPVTQGYGDPVQKSGTGTGATVALIEQASLKPGHVDRTLRDDMSPALQFILEAVAQFAPNGVLYEFANTEDAERLEMVRWVPPRGEIAGLYRIQVMAPNAATSREGRKQSWLLLYQFLRDHLQLWGQMAVQVLQTENPAAINRLLSQILQFQAWVAQQIVEDYDLPGAKEKIPTLPEMTSQDEQINQLQAQIAEMQTQMQGLVTQLQQVGGGAGMPPMPPPGEMPMNGGAPPMEGVPGGLPPPS